MMLVGIDTGGTFTDLVVLEGGRLRVHKVASTPQDPSRAIVRGLEEVGAGVAEIRHGSTVGTNALLERKGARTALVTTRGFRDVLEIARQCRPTLYDLDVERLPPLVPRRLRLEITERLAHDGAVIVPLDESELPRLRAKLAALRVESVAVCLLHAYARPRHERAIRRALRDLRLPVSISSEISPEYREYERCSTTVVNAYLAPVMRRYLRRLESRIGKRLRIMQSNGGLASTRAAIERPVHTVFSGPAAGVVGAARAARAAGYARVIPFDMGGTSTDVSLVREEPGRTTEFEIAGCPIRLPVLDIHTVGAGGGSLAYRDSGGALRVGPESAGADPGPACYGRGDRPTVTDAQVVLGRLRPDAFLGGAMAIEPARAERAVGRLARELGLPVERTAEGIVRVALTTMERAVKVISLERGHDPREYALVAFGGAGALHAAELASGLGIRTVLVPPHPGALSALGLCLADRILDRSKTVLLSGSRLRLDRLESLFREIERRARDEIAREGIPTSRISVRRSVSLRYIGQAHEMDLPWVAGDPTAGFHDAHRRRYGIDFPERDVELVHVRVQATGKIGKPLPPPAPSASRSAPSTRREARVWIGDRRHRVPVLDRDALEPGRSFRGPAVLTEYSATTWVPPGWTARVDARRNLVLRTP